jgi:peptide chain release factor 1
MQPRVARTRRTWCASSSASTSVSAPATVFSCDIIDDRSSIISLQVTGPKADEIFKDEAGGHRWQRIPPNEKRGRVHTSTITVAVLAEPKEGTFVIPEADLEWVATRGSGAGGQARNKVSSAVQLWHIPTKTMVRCESERSQTQNRHTALVLLTAKLYEKSQQASSQAASEVRRSQVGSGMRGDKRRTIRTQEGVVNDHVTGRKWRLKEYIRGQW